MTDYNFATLNDKEFENLTIDLISKEKNKRYERFKQGRDGGIDGRYYNSDGMQEIVQCKHYINTGFRGLIASLKKKNDKTINEIEKVKLLNPQKYIFITSLSLSAENKKIIKELFQPYIKADSDIYGQEDLNQILVNNPDIEKRYYKLWLSSIVVLDKILNNAIESRSEFLLEDIKENAKYYVVTENHNKAIEKLEESNIIIIAGEPGIGKTTLAEYIALRYIEKDFKFYNIENSINEAESIYKRDEKQIFYFDDFLGANYLNAIEDKKDSHIVKFISRIKKDETKRFILTSRTNIFNQSIALSDTFKSKNIENEEYIIEIKSLKDIDKAMILYNHIWHSDLGERFIDEIYIDKRYKKIINHKNFNPRLIVFITDIQKILKEKIEPKNYWNYIVEKLDNPQDVWSNTFDKQSDESMRIIVILTVLNGNKIEESILRAAYNRYINLCGIQSDSNTSKEFDSVIVDVVKYFLNRKIIFLDKSMEEVSFFTNEEEYKQIIQYTLFNPSIADFILNRFKNNDDILIKSILSLKTDESLRILQNFYIKKQLDRSLFKRIIFKVDYNEFDNVNFLVFLSSIFYEELEENNLIEKDKNILKNKIYEIINIISLKEEKIKSTNVYLLTRILSNMIYFNVNIEITECLFKKIVESVDESSQYDMKDLIDFIEDNLTIYLEKFKEIFKLLEKKIQTCALCNMESSKEILNHNTIKRIENIIKKEVSLKIDDEIKSFYNNIGIKDISLYCNKEKIIEFKRALVNGELDSISDNLSFELFKNIKDYNFNILDNKESNYIINKDIDDLFQR